MPTRQQLPSSLSLLAGSQEPSPASCNECFTPTLVTDCLLPAPLQPLLPAHKGAAHTRPEPTDQAHGHKWHHQAPPQQRVEWQAKEEPHPYRRRHGRARHSLSHQPEVSGQTHSHKQTDQRISPCVKRQAEEQPHTCSRFGSTASNEINVTPVAMRLKKAHASHSLLLRRWNSQLKGDPLSIES